MIRTLMGVALLLTTCAAGAATFDEIDYWVGDGANQAALVIDWSEQLGVGEPLVWGYRWDGEATGYEMLRDVLASDVRLSAKMSAPGAFGVALYGVGYDADGDGAFSLNDNTSFASDGVAVTGPSDLAVSSDPDDFYAEGWNFNGFWHYAVGSVSESRDVSWATATAGPMTRVVADGDWEAWTFSPSYSYAAFPDEPTPAPPAGLPGDYNADGRIDAADYVVWRRHAGATPAVAGAAADGDLSWATDEGDLAVWRTNYGRSSALLLIQTPEPAGASLAAGVGVLLTLCRVRPDRGAP